MINLDDTENFSEKDSGKKRKTWAAYKCHSSSYEPNVNANVSQNTIASPRVIFITTDIVCFQEK